MKTKKIKISTELLLLSIAYALIALLFVSDGLGQMVLLIMAFIQWLASQICRCIEVNGKNG